MNLLQKISLINDAPRPWGLYFQDSASPQMEALIELHDNIIFYLAIILFGVAWITASIIRNFVFNKSPINNKYLNHGTLIELIWTVTPALILILIAFPSFKLLYLMDEVTDPSLTIFVEGHQWYWSYQYPDFLSDDNEELEFDSYLVPESDLEEGALRLLEVDNRVMLPELTHVRFIISSGDVIHSYAFPNLDIVYSSEQELININPEVKWFLRPINGIDLYMFEVDGFHWLADTNDPYGTRLRELSGTDFHWRTVDGPINRTAAIKGFPSEDASVNFGLSTNNFNRFRGIVDSQDSRILNAIRDMRMTPITSRLNVKLAA